MMAEVVNLKASQKQLEKEKELVHEKLKNVNVKKLESYIFLCQLFKREPSGAEIIDVAKAISEHAKIMYTREYRRRKSMTLVWFNENLVRIKEYIEKSVDLVYE